MIPADKRIERLTEREIARALGVSRPLVSVLLSEARECGIVTITINNVESAQELLAKRLESRFGLRRAEVVPDAKSAEDTNNLVAARVYELCFPCSAEWPIMPRAFRTSAAVPRAASFRSSAA